MSLVAGLDVGTQGVKLLIYDPQRREVVACASAPLELTAREDGSREQLAQWWIDAVGACFAKVEPKLRQGIRALSVSGQQHGFVPLGADGTVLAPVKLWCDTSTVRECDEIMDAVGGASACIAAAGNLVLPGYTASKVAWLKRNAPDAYRALRTIALPHDYLNFHLTGERFCEAGDASGTGWLDVRRRDWSPELLAAIDPERDLVSCLPPLVEPETSFPILPDIAERYGLSRRIRIGVGGGDNMMAAIGTGCVAAGPLAMSLGTSGTLFTRTDAPVIDDAGAWAAFCSSDGGWLPLICTMNCTVATETVARLCGTDGNQGEAHLAATPAGANGLTLLPLFNGERTPDLPDARAQLLGMTAGNSDAAHLYRAAMEGATYLLRNGFDSFAATGLRFDSIVLTGGGSRSPAWRQIVADVFDLQVAVPRQSEGAAFGAALQALAHASPEAGHGHTLGDLAREHVVMSPECAALPDRERVEAYRAPYARFRDRLHSLQLEAARPTASRGQRDLRALRA